MSLFKYVDLTLLKPEASTDDLDQLIATAKKYNVAGVCVHPYFVKYVSERLSNTSIKVVTVVGFPLGMNTSDIKLLETKEAIKNGAQEIDMVINHNHVLEKNYHLLEQEVQKLARTCHRHEIILKVIVETSRLNETQKEMVCKFLSQAKVDYIKTSTGFTDKGATLEDVTLFKTLCKKLKIKASGGIKTKDQFKALIDAGADRIGTSSIAYLIDQNKTNEDY